MPQTISLHGREYAQPTRPTVVVCIDGCDPEYIVRGIADGVCPTIARFYQDGFGAVADCVMPSFTNPNNVSVVTGAPPAVHGIGGNYYLDRETGREVMMTDAALLRGETLLGLMSQAGVPTAAVTAQGQTAQGIGSQYARHLLLVGESGPVRRRRARGFGRAGTRRPSGARYVFR